MNLQAGNTGSSLTTKLTHGPIDTDYENETSNPNCNGPGRCVYHVVRHRLRHTLLGKPTERLDRVKGPRNLPAKHRPPTGNAGNIKTAFADAEVDASLLVGNNFPIIG